MSGLSTEAARLRTRAVTFEAEAKKLRAAARMLLGTNGSGKKPFTGQVNALRYVRESGMTHQQITARIGYKNADQLANVLYGRTRSKPMLRKLADLFGTDVWEMARPLWETYERP